MGDTAAGWAEIAGTPPAYAFCGSAAPFVAGAFRGWRMMFMPGGTITEGGRTAPGGRTMPFRRG